MLAVTPPAVVLAAFLRCTVRLPDGQTLYALITRQGRFFSVAPPEIFDVSGAPINLLAELGTGAIVRVAVANGLMHAIQIVHARYSDPFRGPS
jgi:hypothetical protein